MMHSDGGCVMAGMWCKWHENPAMEEQRLFCDTYEGYLKLCSCKDPVTKDLRYSAVRSVIVIIAVIFIIIINIIVIIITIMNIIAIYTCCLYKIH